MGCQCTRKELEENSDIVVEREPKYSRNVNSKMNDINYTTKFKLNQNKDDLFGSVSNLKHIKPFILF